jgi:osmotically-inducible protein OsmY
MTALDDSAIETHTDEDLSNRVRQYLLMKRPEFRGIHLEAEGGEVRLMGEVGSFYLKQLAVASASRVAGALRVIDLVTVPEIEPPRPRKAAK